MNANVRQVLIYGVILEIFLLSILLLGNLRQEIPLFLLFYFLAFVTFLVSARHCQQPDNQAGDRAYLLLIIIFFALLFRGTLLFSEPSLSEDIYRYQWDGKLLSEGINPYQFVPGAAELVELRDDQYQVINHKDIGTPYGPLSIMVFAIADSINSSIYFMKVPFILFDCLAIFLIIKMLVIAGLSKYNVIFYAWNPLVVVEVAGSGHNDSLGVLLLLVALYFIQRGKNLSAAAGFTLALMTKYIALLFLPAVLKYFRKGEWIVIPLVLYSGYFYFTDHLESHILNLAQVGSAWRFNDSLFSLLLLLTGSLYLSKILIVSAMLMLSVFVLYSRKTVLENSMIMIGAALLLTTTVQPWYLLWIVPFLCFFPNRAWLLLTGLTMLAYHVLIRYQVDGIWVESLWVKLVIYIPFYLILINDWFSNYLYDRNRKRVN
jgi:hypothetical protein